MPRVSVGIVSDTHGWLDPFLLEVFEGVECIVHAGDIGPGPILEALEKVAPVTAVRGNIDGGPLRALPLSVVVEVSGKRIAVLHIAGSPRRPNREARALLRQERPDVLVVGHSHIPVVGRVEGALWLNPGAAGHEGFHRERTAAILHIEADGSLALDRVVLGPRTLLSEAD